MARQSKDSASDLNANIVIRPSIGAFDGLEEGKFFLNPAR